MVDIRIPIGLMFTIIGVIISIFGLVTMSDSEMYQKSLGVNVNLIMGVLMLIFGLVMLFFAFRKKKVKP
jgi:sulfite exporter TauE/SafE